MRPRRTVEAFDYAAVWQVGPVADFQRGQRFLLCAVRVQRQLAQGLYAVESASFVIAHDIGLAFVNGQCVGSRYGLYSKFFSLLGVDVDVQFEAVFACFQEIQCLGEFARFVLHVEASFNGNPHVFLRDLHGLWGRVDDDALVVDLLAGDVGDILFL